MTAKGDFFPRRINQHVPDMQYAADIRFGGIGSIDIPAPVAADADGILDAHDIATAGSTTTFLDAFDAAEMMGKYGRNVTVVASGAATSTVTVRGQDYLGQPMAEQLTLNGAVTVQGKKAFKYIDEIEYGATAATTIDVGYGNVLGLPYKFIQVDMESVDNAKPGTAGTFVAGLATDTAQSLTTADPRGTYTPHSSVVPDGSRDYKITALWDTSNLHGDAHFYS